ncbi:MAG: Trm112 family protein [Archaeoglobaceae archaeon]
MRRRLLEIICCPACKGEFDLEVEEVEKEVDDEGREEEVIVSGKLVCKKCGRVYPVKDKIPHLLLEEELK